MSHPLTEAQVVLLSESGSGTTPSTLRTLSELRWLEHLGLVAVHESTRFQITRAGRARLQGEAADSRLDR